MRAALEPERIAHLAVRAPNWVGDLVMATPVIEAALAEASSPGRPGRIGRFGRVSVLVREHLAPILAGGPAERHVRALRRGEDEARVLRELGADAVLLLSNSLGAAWRACRARVRVRAGSALSGRRWLLTHAALPPTRSGRRWPIPTQHLQRDAAGLLGILVPTLHPRIHLAAGTAEAARAALERAGLAPRARYALCCPGAAFGQAKLWPPERFAWVLDRLDQKLGLRGVVTGGPGEEALIDAVVAASRRGALSLRGAPRDLETLKGYVRAAEILLVGDSGPRWYAAAFDVPCVTVMGPNFPELTASSMEWCEVVRVEGLACAPCLERSCPLEHHRCMRELAPERVLAAAERLLARRARAVAG